MYGSAAPALSMWRSLATAVILFAVTLLSVLPAPASAQGDASFPAFVLACDAYVQMKGSASGAGYPPECRGIAGVTVTAYSTDGTRLDSCTSDENGVCRLAISYNGVRIFQQDTSAIPEGYRAEANIQRTFTYTEFGEIVFHNYSERAYPMRDGPTATVRVQTRVCPERYMGDSFFDDCDSGVPTTNQWIFGNVDAARAGKDGNAILRDMHAGAGSAIIGGQSDTTGDVFFYCTQTADPTVRVPTSVQLTALYDGTTRDFAGLVDLEPGDDITCDWYQIPLLDRGLWDTLINPIAASDPNNPYPDNFGTIDLLLKRCAEGYVPDTIAGAKENCPAAENSATVHITGADGTLFDTTKTDPDGAAHLSLSGKPATDFWITLDGHDNAEPDLVTCYAVRFQTPDVSTTEQIQQLALFDGAGWTIAGFGDDSGGYICTWYLVPTPS